MKYYTKVQIIKYLDCESTTETPNNVYGYGTINALKAFDMAHALYGNKVELAIE